MLAAAMHFNGYDPENGPFFDELFRAPGRPRPGLEALVAGIDGLDEGVLHARQRAAEHLLLNLGITFTLNGESGDGAERIFPFDIIPRVINAKAAAATLHRSGNRRRTITHPRRVPRPSAWDDGG